MSSVRDHLAGVRSRVTAVVGRENVGDAANTDGTLARDKGAAQFGEVEDYPIPVRDVDFGPGEPSSPRRPMLPMGMFRDPLTGERTMHWGYDFTGTPGSDVLSVASGVVTWAGPRATYGNTVEIDHGNGYITRYAHNKDLSVRAGDHVTAGQLIASLGSTGRVSGPHVHFEVIKDGARINPRNFVKQLR